MTRAVLEGISFGLKDSFELMKQAGLSQINQVRVSGGGSQSAIWRQMLANILNAELVSVFGAALLAGVGVNVWNSIDAACQSTIRVTGSTIPQPDMVVAYQPHYEVFRGLYHTLKSTNETIQQVVASQQ